MAAPKYMTPEERMLRARLAAHSRWGGLPTPQERREATRKARAKTPASYDYWLAKAETDHPDLAPADQAALAKNWHSAEMSRRALRSSQATRRKTA